MVEDSFGYLDAPVERIAGADIPMPYAANFEKMAVPQVQIISSLLLIIIHHSCLETKNCQSSLSFMIA